MPGGAVDGQAGCPACVSGAASTLAGRRRRTSASDGDGARGGEAPPGEGGLEAVREGAGSPSWSAPCELATAVMTARPRAEPTW